MNEACVDTTFLIDLQRSRKNQFYQDATTWLNRNPSLILKLPVVVVGEFAAGFSDPHAPELAYLCSNYEILAVGKEVAFQYREIFRDLKNRGELIGGNDIWIAATAMSEGLPLVTRNVTRFRRVKGLMVEEY